MLGERFMPDPGSIKPMLCDALIRKITAGEPVAFNGRKIAEHKNVLKQFGIPIEDLLEHMLTVRQKGGISSETLLKLKQFGEKAIGSKQKICCFSIKWFSKENPKLDKLLVDLETRIVKAKMHEIKKYSKKTGHLPPILEDREL